jgi:hypothetical protein
MDFAAFISRFERRVRTPSTRQDSLPSATLRAGGTVEALPPKMLHEGNFWDRTLELFHRIESTAERQDAKFVNLR